jgi:tRNA threonylcarbamoyladenosine biosynthesis protein TsaB
MMRYPGRPLVLAIDTTTPTLGLALAAGVDLIADLRLPIPTSHSETLLSCIDQCLRRHGFEGPDLEGLAAVSGPGSFTGIRIGLATAQGLADGWNRPLYGRNSLELCALRAGVADGIVCPVFPASRGGLYYAVFCRSGSDLTLLGSAGEIRAGEDPGFLKDFSELTLLGPGAAALASLLSGGRPSQYAESVEPSPAGVLALDTSRAVRSGRPPAPRLEAFYIRPPDAKKPSRWRGFDHGS